MNHTAMERLQELRDFGGQRQTIGLSDEILSQFIDLDPNLDTAIEEAVGVNGAATNAGAALTVHHLSVGCRAHDMLSGLIKAVVLHVHGEVTLIVGLVNQVIEVT